jgi:hypothetical protein
MGSLAFAVTLAGCTAPMVAGTRPAPEGSSVALGQPVQVGRLVATPKAVVEDSRCPENARCIWAGRLIVSTQIDGPSWRETIPLTLGEAHATHDTAITLVSGTPEKRTGNETFAGDYRFTFEGGN